MIDHMMLRVRDYATSKAFYVAALAPIGYQLVMEFQGTQGGIGAGRKPDLWIAQETPDKPTHIAFAGPDRASVDAFHRAALAAGAKDNGPPGLRADYHPNYYAAFVFDPDGNNIEVVCHKPA